MRKTLFVLASLFLIICSTGVSRADEARLLRFPTTNGSDIVFTYAGDLYKVPASGGQAVRLTSHVGYEMFPKFSPDGKTIAFSGQYDGNTEVYSVPATGGEPLRLTYTATNSRDDLGDRMGPNNIVMGWKPDGQEIIYRNRISGSFTGKLWTINKEGGLSTVIPLPEGGFCSYSPDGKQLAYNRVMREFRTWKYYEGGMADDLWIYDPAKATVTNITENKAQDIMPMWIGDNIFFISDRDRTMNMFVYNTKTKTTEKVTNFTEYDIKFPSHHGNMIVFENAGYIYKMDANTRKPEKVSITLSSDNVYARSGIKDGSRYVSSVSLSPDGQRLTVTARGEVFDVPAATSGVTRNITRTAGANERGSQWSPDGKYVAYISDRTGETEIYLYNVADGTTTQMTDKNDTYISSLQWSPDSKYVLYTDRRNRATLLDIATKKKNVLIQDPNGVPGGLNFSPDSRWIAYTRQADNTFNVIYVMDIASKKEYPVTDKWHSSSGPVFSRDGKYLVFNSARDFTPTYSSTEWNHVYNDMNAMYIALLKADTPSPFLQTDPEVNAVKEDGKKSEGPVQVDIDTDGLTDRIVRVPLPAGSYRISFADNGKIFYGTSGGTKFYDLAKQKVEDVCQGNITAGWGKKALVSQGRNYYVVDMPTGKVNVGDPVSLANMSINTDYPAEWAQIFDEAWRGMRDGFYLENMHGVDWKAMKKKYEVLVPHVKNRLDLNYVIGEMIGELNCGHAYIAAGEMDRPEKVNLGLLGAEISRDRSGFFKLEKILDGATWSPSLRSPLRDPGIKANVGDYIVAIDGVPTNTVNDMYKLLVGKAGVPTELSLNSKPELAGARKVAILPLAEEHSLYHFAWVQENIRKVDEATNGKVGYIYIPDMGVEGLNEFARYFYPQLDKEGLIIDDRANGGGNVSPMILERLQREPYRLTMRRGSAVIGTVPDAVQVGPKVCLINKYSASDGDLFPWGFRALNLGKLIGTRTWGGIVGISGSLPFIDGTQMNVPFFTSFDPKTGEWIIENYGVAPDIEVDNDPIQEWKGNDQQLNRAIEEVMKDLKNRKPLPPVPAPRNFSK